MSTTKLFSYEEVVGRARETRPLRFREYLNLLRRLWGLKPDHVLYTGDPLLGVEELLQNVVLTGYGDMDRAEEAAMMSYHAGDRDPLHALIGIVLDTPVAWYVRHPVKVWDKTNSRWIFRGWEACYWKNGVDGISVNILPYTADGRVLMVAAHRGPVVPEWHLEFPGGGKVGAKTLEEVVHLQLFEEAGFRVNKIRRLPEDEDVRFIVDSSTNGTPIVTVAVELGPMVEGGHMPQVGEVIARQPVLLGKKELLAAYARGRYPHPTVAFGRCNIRSGRNGDLITLAIANNLVR